MELKKLIQKNSFDTVNTEIYLVRFFYLHTAAVLSEYVGFQCWE